MICSRCGNEISNEKLLYCTRCGAPINRVNAVQEPQMTNNQAVVNQHVVYESQGENKKVKGKKRHLKFLIMSLVMFLLMMTMIAISAIANLNIPEVVIGVMGGITAILFFTWLIIGRDLDGTRALPKIVLSIVIFVVGTGVGLVVIAVAIQSIDVVYNDYKMKNPLELSMVSEKDLESGIYVEGTIYKVMSKVGEFDGKSYFTVMLPSTDMTDWEALNKSYIGQAMDLLGDKLPLTDVRQEDRRVLVVSTEDKEMAEFFEKMVDDNEHWLSSKYLTSRGECSGLFKVNSITDSELKEAFEKAAIGQDETLLGFGRLGIGKENLCYYELSIAKAAPSGGYLIFCYLVTIAVAAYLLRSFFRWLIKPKKSSN